MLRRVARLLRSVLFGIGVILLLLVLLPDDFGGFTTAGHVPGTRWVVLGIQRGQFALYAELNDPRDHFAIRYAAHTWHNVHFDDRDYPVVPHFESNQGEVLAVIPLWLLAFLCLAWPVTSFLLARRRRGRGFPVEITTHE